MGLSTILRFVKSTSGRLDIISNNSLCSFDSEDNQNSTIWSNHFPGSIINIEIEPKINENIIFDDTNSEDEWF